MAELSKQYDPQAHEAAVYTTWEKAGVFSPHFAKASRGRPDEASRKSSKPPFVIMLPPPNITGSLHMGHALQDTIMDILSRWHRMMGEPVLWLPGTDHAALPTNKIIIDQLYRAGKTKETIGREAFMQQTDEWYAKTGAQILHQMRRLGCSCDWSRHRFTMDKKYYTAVQEAFVRYYKQGYIYRGARIVNWDPKTCTTVSDLEIDWKTEKTSLYTFQYGPFEISTARPETKFGDKYVVMHPADTRYAQYADGDTFEAEWINGKVTATVVKDAAIDMAFGTGVMTITPWHDSADFEIAQRHKLDMEPIIGLDGKLLPVAGEFAGTDAVQSRPLIVTKLKDKRLLVSVDENYEHNVALNDRGKGTIEPQVMRQWFVDMSKLKTDTIQSATKDLIRFVPTRWKQHFISWMEQVHDWNINRQIWLGHRVPVWWKKGTHGTANEDGNFAVSLDPPAGGSAGDFEQDPDVLDTWFSSALWPFATLGWPDNTPDLKTFYPTSVLVTGRDILYLWVARMVFSGLELLKDAQYKRPQLSDRIPFHDVFIHPTVLTKTGQRMSKSLGTGVDPLDLVEKYGADATRFGLMYQMSYDSQAIRFDEAAIKAARNFANKLWNIARLLATNQEGVGDSVADRWIVDRLGQVTQSVTQLLTDYKFGEAARLLHEFIWREYADWYLEIVKVEGSLKIAREVWQQVLALLHPFMPHITEVVWPNKERMLIVSAWPRTSHKTPDASAAEQIAHVQDVVTAIRSARDLFGIKPSTVVEVYCDHQVPLPGASAALARATFVANQTSAMRPFPTAAGRRIYLGSIDITSEKLQAARESLEKDATKAEQQLETAQKVLASMRGKAPADKIAAKEALVAQIEQKLEEIRRSQKLVL